MSMTPTNEASVFLRIVVYGPSQAGKTSTCRALGAGMNQEVVTPEEESDGRTTYFDWMEYLGGRHNGKPILTRMVSVPGHDQPKRIALLHQADVVLFVADSTSQGMTETVASYEEMTRELNAVGSKPGIVVQANKRDLDSAIPIDEFREHLGLGETEIVIETIASEGEGVRQAFVYAVRQGLERMGERSADEEESKSDFSPDSLLEILNRSAATDRIEAPVEEAAAPAPDTGDSDTVIDAVSAIEFEELAADEPAFAEETPEPVAVAPDDTLASEELVFEEEAIEAPVLEEVEVPVAEAEVPVLEEVEVPVAEAEVPVLEEVEAPLVEEEANFEVAALEAAVTEYVAAEESAVVATPAAALYKPVPFEIDSSAEVADLPKRGRSPVTAVEEAAAVAEFEPAPVASPVGEPVAAAFSEAVAGFGSPSAEVVETPSGFEPTAAEGTVTTEFAEPGSPFAEASTLETSSLEASMVEASMVEASMVEASMVEASTVDEPALDAAVIPMPPMPPLPEPASYPSSGDSGSDAGWARRETDVVGFGGEVAGFGTAPIEPAADPFEAFEVPEAPALESEASAFDSLEVATPDLDVAPEEVAAETPGFVAEPSPFVEALPQEAPDVPGSFTVPTFETSAPEADPVVEQTFDDPAPASAPVEDAGLSGFGASSFEVGGFGAMPPPPAPPMPDAPIDGGQRLSPAERLAEVPGQPTVLLRLPGDNSEVSSGADFMADGELPPPPTGDTIASEPDTFWGRVKKFLNGN